MTPGEFIAKWRASELKERSAAQEHFIDLCRLLGEPTPAEADSTGERYCFERGARKDTGGDGWADVWKRHCFAWEYKGKHADLDAVFNQLRQYALALENPPLLIVSDMARFRIRTPKVPLAARVRSLDEQRQPDSRVRARRSRGRRHPRQAQVGDVRPGTAPTGREPAGADRARGGDVRGAGAVVARARPRAAGGGALRQPPGVLHVRRGRGPAARRHVHPHAAAGAETARRIRRRNGFNESRDPILKPLETIECRDAILTPERGEPEWPAADVVIGNPPFLGGKLLNTHLGEDYVSAIFKVYAGRVPAEADLVCYWFVKAGEQVEVGRTKRVGLVSTNSIRGGANRRALQTAIEGRPIFEAWSDEPWVIDGAAVRVSLVCFAQPEEESAPAPERRLDGELVDAVHADLTARRGVAGVDLTGAQRLYRNMGVAFMGDTKGGPFDVPGEQAREWLREPANPHGRPNSDVLGPWMNGMDVTRRPADKWIVDFGWDMVREEAALYEAPFQHAKEHVYPMRQRNRRESYREHWWRHVEPRQGMWRALDGLSRYIATPRVAKHRLFTWLDARIRPDSQLIVIARDDDVTFGILHSRFHEAWSLRLGTSLEDRPRYTPTTTFETFPFPEGLSPDVPASDYAGDPQAAAIAEAARRLVSLRDRWLNPPELVEWVDEPVPGYPRRPVPHDEEAEKALKKRTLTTLDNARPQWLADTHAALDAAVAAAYGWDAGISEDDALRELSALNLAGDR